MSEQPQRDMQAINALKLRIAQELGETDSRVTSQIWFIIYLKGIDFATEILRETHAIEAAGGMFLERQQRRRTPGGVFFHLVKTRVTSRERYLIFEAKKQQQKPAHKRAARPQEPRTEPDRPAVAPLSAEVLPEVIAALTHEYGKAITVKITVIGRPAQVVERGDVVIFGLLNEKSPALPKGLPPPPAQTKYLVLVAKKQWSKVAGVVKDAEDVLIIEGFPAYEPRHAGITVYALSVTTKKQQAAKRET
jgi:hypothetical protein